MKEKPQNNGYEIDLANLEAGKSGEDIAVDYLISKNYEIIKRNFRFGKSGEIDIICRDKNILVFVEVKTRKNESYGDALLSITPTKIKHLKIAARGYLYINKIENTDCRFDAIVVEMNYEPSRVRHLENII